MKCNECKYCGWLESEKSSYCLIKNILLEIINEDIECSKAKRDEFNRSECGIVYTVAESLNEV